LRGRVRRPQLKRDPLGGCAILHTEAALFDVVLTVLICVAVLVGFVAIFEWIQIRFVHYRLDEQGLSVDGDLWWRKPIPYWQIESVKVISWLDWLLTDREVSWFKRRFYARTFARRFVTVRHRDGRVFILTPHDPETFVSTLNDRIAGTAPPKPLIRGRSSDPGLHDNVAGQEVPR